LGDVKNTFFGDPARPAVAPENGGLASKIVAYWLAWPAPAQCQAFDVWSSQLYGGVSAFDVDIPSYFSISDPEAPCGLWHCKNRPAPFPGWMSYKATKPVLSLSLGFFW